MYVSFLYFLKRLVFVKAPESFFRIYYQYIKNNDKFAGVCGMKCFPDGSRIGKEVTWKILKDSWINYWIIKNIKGDVAFVFKTSVLRNYLFDDIPGEKFCAESLVLNRIGKNYLMLFLSLIHI